MGASNSYVKEKDIDNNAISIPTSALEVILDLSKKSIGKIKSNEQDIATCFFCAIPFPDKYNRLPVLVTNNHVLKKEDITEGKIIRFSTNNEEHKFKIKIDENRKKYTNEKYDITFIEIKKDTDNININSFLDIDDEIFEENYENLIVKKSVYLLHYPHGNLSEYSSGIMKGFFLDEKFSFRHSCQTQNGSSGSPVINLINHKVIGIHKGYKENLKYNIGTVLKDPINDFYLNITNPKVDNLENKESDEFLEKSLKNIDTQARIIKNVFSSYLGSIGFDGSVCLVINILEVIRNYLNRKNKKEIKERDIYPKSFNFRKFYNEIIKQINEVKYQVEHYNFNLISIEELNDIEYNVNLINESFPDEKVSLFDEFYNSH